VAARELGLGFVGLAVELEAGPNLAARAREARRAVLQGVGTDRIATGHHETDQAETVLFHMLRGSGARGLRGMQPLDGPWCRPLLFEPRAVLEAWASAEGLDWVEDPSNATSQRGLLREIMPRLDTVHGGASGALARSARLLAREDALLDDMAEVGWAEVHDAGGVNRTMLARLHPALQLRLLRRLVAPCPAQVRADPLEAVLTGALLAPGSLDLGEGWRLVQAGGWLRLEGPG
jgi:tRNA(Ile)-lysidine synthase